MCVRGTDSQRLVGQTATGASLAGSTLALPRDSCVLLRLASPPRTHRTDVQHFHGCGSITSRSVSEATELKKSKSPSSPCRKWIHMVKLNPITKSKRATRDRREERTSR
jgi:hypothetical protein